MTVKEKRELRKELKTTKENVRKDGGYIYISAGTLILVIIRSSFWSDHSYFLIIKGIYKYGVL